MTNTLRVTIFGANLGDIERELHVRAVAYFGTVPYEVVEIDATEMTRNADGSVRYWTAYCLVVEDT